MAKTSDNSYLQRAKDARDDEFYTPLSIIANQIPYYEPLLAGKRIYCNCDDPEQSNFVKYFQEHFNRLKLNKLCASYYKEYDYEEDYQNPLALERTAAGCRRFKMIGDGSFQSGHSQQLLKESDIVITNPPFSLFLPFIGQLLQSSKDFLFIGPQANFRYTRIMAQFSSGKLFIGPDSQKVNRFYRPDGSERSVGCMWYSSLPHNQKPAPLILKASYSAEKYPKYDNLDAINVDKLKDIPADYDGPMGVPANYVFHHDPARFSLKGFSKGKGMKKILPFEQGGTSDGVVLNGNLLFARLIIQRL